MKNKKLSLALMFMVYILSIKAIYIASLLPIKVKAYDDNITCKSIVVLGARDDYDKILKALELYQVNDVEILIFSGMHEKYKDIVSKFGLKNAVFEDSSTNTYENATYSKSLLKSYSDICLVSREAHLFRARKVFDKQGMTTYPVTANNNSLDIKLNYFIPDLKYFVLNISVLYEYLAIIKYKFQKRI